MLAVASETALASKPQPPTKVFAWDSETYYDNEVSIRTLGLFNYTNHPRTRTYIISCVTSEGHKYVGPPDGFDFSSVAGEDWLWVSHNQGFESAVYARLHKESPEDFPLPVNPPECTADLSAYLGSPRSLKDAAKFLLKKDASKDVRNKMKGKDWSGMSEEFRKEVAEYALYDSELCLEIWMRFNHFWPEVEREISRLTRSMAGRGLPVNRPYLEQGKEIMGNALAECLAQIPWGEPILSKPQLNRHCESLGIPAPKSMAKDSEEFAAWLEKYGEEHTFAAAVSRYRKVNVALSRIEAMLARTRPVAGGHWMDYGLMYFGATTTGRWSGGDGFNCMTGDHEVLTPSGWVEIERWDPRNPIVQWDDGALSFVKAKKVSHEFEGNLVIIDQPRVSLRATPDHRVVGRRSNGEIRIKTAKDVLRSGITNIPRFGSLNGVGSERTDTELRLLVALAADGSVNKKGRVSFGFRRRRKIERLRELLGESGIKFIESTYPRSKTVYFAVNKTARPEWLTKGFGSWVLSLSPQQASVVLDELHHWDGSEHKHSGATVFYTSKKDQAEWVATLAHLHNRPVSVNDYTSGGHTCYQVYFLDPKEKVTIPSTKYLWSERYLGKVFCPQVPSGMFLVRHRGRIHVTGNCQNQNKKHVEGYDQRAAIIAPEGYLLCIADYSQIEPRVLTWLAGDKKTLKFMAESPDFYDAQARAMGLWDSPEPLKSNPDLRHMVKQFAIGLGYGMSAGKFSEVTGTSAAEAERLVALYREKNPMVRALWSKLNMAFKKSVGSKQFTIELPTGRNLRYFEPKMSSTGDATAVMCRRIHGKEIMTRSKTWPGLLTENLTQATAREVMAYAMPKIEAMGYPVLLTVHDELVTLVPKDGAEEAKKIITETMARTPDWAPGLTLAVDSKLAEVYSKD